MNSYSFGNANPMMFTDPRGLTGAVVAPGPGGPAIGIIINSTPISQFGSRENVEWARNAGNAIESGLGSLAEIIDFQKKKRERDKAKESEQLKNCPPPEDNGCYRKQQQLLVQRELVSKNLFKVQLWEYRSAVMLFNGNARLHNMECPDFPVAELTEPGPEMPLGSN
jgi:hypothetical protein